MRILHILSRLSPTAVTAIGVAMVAMLGGVDVATGSEISFSIFYLLPIAMTAWYCHPTAGLLMALLSGAMWLAADVLSGHAYSHPMIPYWNALVRLGFFLITTYTLSALRAARVRREELGQFIVHDLRSPLANVMTGLETIEDVRRDPISAAERELMDACRASCTRMLLLVNSILDLARIEDGQMPLHLQRLSVKELVAQAIDQVVLLGRRSRVEMTTTLHADVEAVYADPMLTSRVLVNLLGNAIKFSPAGSVVSLGVAPADTSTAAFRVTDQGPGIPEISSGTVFDRFRQGDAAHAAGTGLGLAFCRRAVQAQGGRIWVEGAAPHGTAVTFTLPTDAR